MSDIREALEQIANGEQCTNYTGPPYCRDPRSGRRRDADFGAERWCDACIAREALDRPTTRRRFYPPTDSDVYHGHVVGRVYVDAHRERIRAHDKHKDKPGGSMEMKDFDEPDWLAVVTEELGEVAKVLCDWRHGLLDDEQMRSELRTELMQTAAMACAWIDAIDQTPREARDAG